MAPRFRRARDLLCDTLALAPRAFQRRVRDERASLRLEYRHDGAAGDMFFGGPVVGDGVATPFILNRSAQDTLTIGATTWF